MPINTDLNISPYYDDYDIENQFYKVLFKPAYAVQARELTQLQTILQNQIEQFGDNIFKEGSIIKGSTFTNLSDLKYVKLNNKTGFDPELYKPVTVVEEISGVDTDVDIIYQVEGLINGLKANIISAQIGYETRPPDLNTFWVNYLNTNESVSNADYRKAFQQGEELNIVRYKFVGGQPHPTQPGPDIVQTCNVTDQVNATGNAFGIQSAPGIVFQKGHFLFTSTQTLIVEKYSNAPNNVSVGYKVQEELINQLNDDSLYDNALGSKNYNAPGADRLKLTPILTVLPTATADADKDFFTLIRYQNGDAVLLRDVSQYNVIGEEMAKRTFEESGNYVVEKFNVVPDRRNGDLTMLVNPGIAYVKGHRVENKGQRSFTIEPVTSTATAEEQPINQSYGGYVDIVAFGGTNTSIPDIDNATYDLQNASNVDIGTVRIRNITPTRVYISMINMSGSNNFSDAKYIQTGSGNSDHIEIAENSVLKDADRTPMIFNTGAYSVESTANTTIVKRLKELKSPATTTSMQITILNTADENFDCNNDDVLIIQSDGTLHTVTNTEVNVNNSVLTITTSTNMTNTCYVYYNKRVIATPYAKTVATPYIKSLFNAVGTNQRYQLGFPDVFEIMSVVDANGRDYKNSFRLKPNQKDTHYDRSYMEYIPGRPKPATGTLTVQLKCFQVNPNDDYFFTVDSYPIDDSDTPAAGTIRSNQIGVYESANGERYNLRECFDFRPYVTKDGGVDYTDTAGTAGTLTTFTEIAVGLDEVNFGTLITPANDNFAQSDLDYYLSRIDHIAIDSYGTYSVVKGTEEENPAPPKIDDNQLIISTITLPGYPALTPKEAAQQRKNYYAITVKSSGIKNYTMKDIQRIDNKIQAIEYQVLLNKLEQEVQNLNILDENGLTRFKNGYIVEPFKDLQLANLEDNSFSASVPFDKEILAPAVRTFPLDLKLKSNTNATIFPDTANPEIATLSRNAHVSLISQTYATGFRNAVSNFYKYSGVGKLSPSHDAVHDTIADPINIVNDFSAPFDNFLENLQEFIPLTGTQTTTFQQQIGNAAQWFPTTVTRTRTSTLALGESNEQTFNAGDMVSNINFEPYMRSRDIKIYMSGLRPDTRHYFFFDGVSVDSHVMPGTDVDSAREVERFGAKGAEVKTDSNGILRAVFNIPAESFFVGDRELEVVDVSQYASIDSASTSYGSLMYHAFNIDIEKTNITSTVRIPTFDINTTTTERNGPRRARPQPRDRGTNNGDPLAQTFFIKEGMGKGSGSVFASKVDLYFKKKSTTNGVNIQLREVVNGYPSAHIIPFSEVHLTPSQVSVTDDASTATTVDFEAPVRLDVDKEYAVVIKPDANDPNYLVFTSKVGQTDITPGNVGAAVVQDWGDGVLFTSTNNRAWKSYQDEDIKFAIYRHDFNAATGSVTLSPENLEFFSISDLDGEFLSGEQIYQEKALTGATVATVSGVLGNDFVTGTAVNETYAAGMSVIIKDSTNTFRDIFTIASVDSATQVTLNKKLPFVVTSGTMYPCVTGSVNYFNVLSDEVLYLRQSTADATLQFEGVDVTLSSTLSAIEGLDSRATAVIDSVDNINVSYVQPMILKSNDAITTTTMSGQFNDPANTLQNYNLPMKFADNNYFNKKGNLLYSKSNDTTNSKPFDLTINMANKSNSTSTPLVDLETASLIAYQYKSTNSADTTSKYISKTIELKESLDAEDFNVILTGYRPLGTDIKVYIRPINAYDYTSQENIDWVELELVEGINLYSSAANVDDYKEFSYKVPEANLTAGVLTYSSSFGDFSGFRKFAVRIDLISSNNYQVPYVADYRGIALT